MRRDAQPDVVRRDGPEALDGSRELRQTGGTLRRVRPEHLLVVDASCPEPCQRLERGTGAARVSDARDARRPAVAHAELGRAGELLGGGGVLERADGTDPRRELPLGILPGEMAQLEVGMAID